MNKTPRQLEVEISTISAAIQELMQGKKITTLTIGSGEFVRTYQFQQVNYESLLAEKKNLQHELDTLIAQDNFSPRRNNYIPLVVNKLED